MLQQRWCGFSLVPNRSTLPMHVPARLTHVADTLLSRNGEMGSLLVWFVDCDSLRPRLLHTFFPAGAKM